MKSLRNTLRLIGTDKIPTQIYIENLSFSDFPEGDVLITESEKQLRLKDLQMAALLGNVFQAKSKIVFEDCMSKKEINTIIWKITSDKIYFKKSISIPIHRIISVTNNS